MSGGQRAFSSALGDCGGSLWSVFSMTGSFEGSISPSADSSPEAMKCVRWLYTVVRVSLRSRAMRSGFRPCRYIAKVTCRVSGLAALAFSAAVLSALFFVLRRLLALVFMGDGMASCLWVSEPVVVKGSSVMFSSRQRRGVCGHIM